MLLALPAINMLSGRAFPGSCVNNVRAGDGNRDINFFSATTRLALQNNSRIIGIA